MKLRRRTAGELSGKWYWAYWLLFALWMVGLWIGSDGSSGGSVDLGG